MKINAILQSVFFLLLSVFSLNSCKRYELNDAYRETLSRKFQIEHQIQFAKMLAQLIENENVRAFIKNEALEKFGGDFDIFYPLIKNKMLSDGLTFRQHIVNLIIQQKLAVNLEEIEANLPLLNILVPEFELFNASKWDTRSVIPIVGVRVKEYLKQGKKMIAYDYKGNVYELDYHTAPGMPIIIIKDNESVEIRNSKRGLNTIEHSWVKNHNPVLISGDVEYYFSDESLYDEKLNLATNAEIKNDPKPYSIETAGCSRVYNFNSFDILAQQAYTKNIYNPICPDNVATTRDYIYYGIDPVAGINQGPLKYNYREYITSIRVEDANGISRFDDIGEGSILDFDIIVYTADHDPIFPLKKRLAVPKASFYLTNSGNPTPTPYELLAYGKQLELAVWNFKRQGDIWKFAIFEYDPSTIITESRTVTANLGVNFTVGDEKVGGKFGLTASVSQTNTITISYTNTSDDLGEAVSYWCDPVIKERFTVITNSFVCGWASQRPIRGGTDAGRSHDIGTGYIAITVEPRAMN